MRFEDVQWWEEYSDFTHLTLATLGTIPVVGVIADTADALLYYSEGRYFEAGLSLAAATPGVGYAFTAARYASLTGRVYRASRAVDIGVNFVQSGYAVYQGVQTNNPWQIGLGLVGFGINGLAVRGRSGRFVAPKGIGDANALTGSTIRQLARLGQRKFDLTSFASRIRKRFGVDVLLDQASSFANKFQIGFGKRILRSEVPEEILHLRQFRGEFDQAIKKIMKRPEFRAVPGTRAERLAAAREIHAKQLLVDRKEVFGIGWFNEFILRAQLQRLWKSGITRGY